MRIVNRVTIFILFLLLVAGSIGVAYNYLAIRHGRMLSPPPGHFYAVGGYAMHLYCSGSGAPTVVLDGGLGSDWINWQLVQPDVAKMTRVCSYDRAGLGWSDPRPGARDARALSDQLHDLLQVAGINGGLVLVGQSAGGLYVRQYATKYASEVVGLVLVDSTPPESFSRIPTNRENPERRARRHREALLQKWEDAIGLARLMGKCKAALPRRLQEYARYEESVACRPEYEVSWLGETDDFEKSADEVRNTAFGGLPIIIISQDPDRPKPAWSAGDIAANPIWAAMQEDLKRVSTHSYRIIARGSGHHVEIDRPDVIIIAVRQLILTVRSQLNETQSYGATVIR